MGDKGTLCTVSYSLTAAMTHYQDSVINDPEESMEGLKDVLPVPPTVSSIHCRRE